MDTVTIASEANGRQFVAQNLKLTDRRWFKKNRHRTHRLRREVPGEFPNQISLDDLPPGFVNFVVVQQIEPGIRSRRPVTLRFNAPADRDRFAANDTALWMLFTQIANAARGAVINLDDLLDAADRETTLREATQ